MNYVPFSGEISYATPYRLGPVTTLLRARNPNPMTGLGTNTYLLNTGTGFIVVDPGPNLAEHLDAICAMGDIEGIFLTHEHIDHAEATEELVARTGAPVTSSSQLEKWPGTFVCDVELKAGELVVVPVATPGHTNASVSFFLPEENALLCGDSMLKDSSVAIAPTPGSLSFYLDTLTYYESLAGVAGYPGHGDPIPDLVVTATKWKAHRRARLDEMQRVLDEQCFDPSTLPEAMTELYPLFYPPLEGIQHRAAQRTLSAQLEYLYPEHFPAVDAL
jgi:glyoxylase-like metal-dependent hydrolase (beta-lactamase superfamily II)